MRCVPVRLCHWCAWNKKRKSEMITILEAPMRYHFCGEACLCNWQQQRREPAVAAWLRNCAGDRYKILKALQDEQAASEMGGTCSTVCSVDHV